MALFYLYRLKIERSDTPSMFDDQTRQPGAVILSAIEEKPSQEIRKGQTWHIGNIQKVERDTVFFALGKVTKATHQFYDEEKGDFIEESLEEAPNTYVAVDLNLQICAVAQKSKIASQAGGIARNLAKLLSASHEAKTGRLAFTLSDIPDPDEFLELIKNAKRITEFEITLSPPNPWDVNRQFHRPMEEFIRAANGMQGKSSVRGDDLNAEVIEDLARSAASTGNKAEARIQSTEDEKPVLKKLDGNPVTVSAEELVTNEEKKDLFSKIREAYRRVRGKDQSS